MEARHAHRDGSDSSQRALDDLKAQSGVFLLDVARVIIRLGVFERVADDLVDVFGISEQRIVNVDEALGSLCCAPIQRQLLMKDVLLLAVEVADVVVADVCENEIVGLQHGRRALNGARF